MKVGDLAHCTFGPHGYVTLLEKHPFDSSFWNVLWNGKVVLMHSDHLRVL